MSRTWRQALVFGVALGLIAGAAAYGFILWYIADRNRVLCDPGYAGTLQVLLSIPTFLLIAGASGYLGSDGRAVWPALATGLLVGILAGIANVATVPMLDDQFVRMYHCPVATDPTVIGPSLADLQSSTLTIAVIGSAIGLVLAPLAAAGGHFIKRNQAPPPEAHCLPA